MARQLDLGPMPFYWRMTDSPGLPSNPVPDLLPFIFEQALDGAWMRRTPDNTVETALDEVYRLSENVGYLQDGHALATAYGGDFLAFVEEVLEARSGNRMLEVGSGAGWFLSKMVQRGWTCFTCDPSPVAEAASRRHGSVNIPHFYERERDYPEVDLITHYDVLEHVEEPIDFLRTHLQHLSKEGTVIFAVPDCTRQFELGDVSMAIHEHRNYFTVDSVATVMRAAGLLPLAVKRGETGGVLLCAARREHDSEVSGDAEVAAVESSHSQWFDLAGRHLRFVRDMLEESKTKGDRVALYIPLRGVTYAAPFLGDLDLMLVDDDPGVHGRYFDGIPVPVLPSSVLEEESVNLILAMTTSYESQITRHVRNLRANSSTVLVTPSWVASVCGAGSDTLHS